MLYEVYGTITKKSLMDRANLVKERFNKANFKAKSTNSIQHINRVVSAGTKKKTYHRLGELFMHICFEEHEDHIDISDFIVER